MSFTAKTWLPLRTKEAAIKSTPCLTPNLICSMSASVNGGKSTLTPGKETPFRELSSSPPITTSQ